MGRFRPSPPDRSVVFSPAESEDAGGQEVAKGVSHSPPVPVKPAGGMLTGTDPYRLHLKCRFCGRLQRCKRPSAGRSSTDAGVWVAYAGKKEAFLAGGHQVRRGSS